MKKIISILTSFVLSFNFLSFNVFAYEVAPTAVVCPAAEIQYGVQNLDCSITWSGSIRNVKYTYDDYIGTYENQLKANYKYTKNYLDSLNLRWFYEI